MISDREYQIKNLRKIFEEASFAPCFKNNPKYPIKEGTPRIAYEDVMNWRYIIRLDKETTCDPAWSNKNAEEIARYSSIEELVDDGWRLD